jgi:Ser/Thr protein kinase RdoA (MazF antagonist)
MAAAIPAAPLSLLSPEALLAEVGHAYAIAPPVDCALLRSYVNDVYTIATTAGDYILKVYRARWRSWSEIAYELDVLAHLTARGVAVAPAIARRDGRRIGAIRLERALDGDRGVLRRGAGRVAPLGRRAARQ